MKRSFKGIICSVMLLSFTPTLVFPAGYPVFDASGWLAAIDQLYQSYDMVTNTITQIENQYTQIQQAIERAKSIDWDNIRFDGDFDIRNDIRDANKRVNKLLTQARNIKKSITTPSINCGNARYSIADLCGMTDPDENGVRKNMLTALTDYKDYMTSTMSNAVNGIVEGLDEKEKKAIWKKYGISPANYVFVQTAHTEVLKAASNVLANASDAAVEASMQESLLKTSNIIRAATETVDSEGNPTQTSLGEATLYLCQQLVEELQGLKKATYETGTVAAQIAMEQDAQKVAQENAEAEANEIQDRKENKVSSRFKKE